MPAIMQSGSVQSWLISSFQHFLLFYNHIVTTSDWITLGVGIFASAVAIAALVWNIIRERHNITVRVRYAYGSGSLGGGEMVAIEIINNGHRPIHIQEIGFWLSDGSKLINPGGQHDLVWLKDGDGTSWYIPKQEVVEMVKGAKEHGLRVVAAYVRDSTSRYCKGKISKNSGWFNK